MKIGIATYFWENIPGQYFQALATYNELKGHLPDAKIEFINVKHWDYGWRPSFRPGMFTSSITKRMKYIKARSYLPLSLPPLLSTSRNEIVDYINSKKYDLIVVGSDVLLKPLPNFLGDQLPYYWIDRDIKAKKVMIASSADITRIDQLSDSQIIKMKETLEEFSYVGLRDSMTYELIKSLGYGDKACRVPDPTFNYLIPEANNARLEKIKLNSTKKLCGISLSPNQFNINLVKELEKRYTVICLRYPWKSKLSVKYIGPFEWCNIFRYLDLVVTMSFHESIFSFKSGIPACAIDYNCRRIDLEKNRSKTLSLVSDMGLPNHHINPHKDGNARNWSETIFDCCEGFNSDQVANRVKCYAERYRESVEQAIRSAR